jgi:hypothetical protein
MGLERGAEGPKLSDGAADFLRIALDRCLGRGRHDDLDRDTCRKADDPRNNEKEPDDLSFIHAGIWPANCGEVTAFVGKNRGEPKLELRATNESGPWEGAPNESVVVAGSGGREGFRRGSERASVETPRRSDSRA